MVLTSQVVFMAHIYQIRIKGHLDQSWTDWFEGFSIAHEPDGTTILTGSVVDQPALHGLLARINSLGLPILLVEQIESDSE